MSTGVLFDVLDVDVKVQGDGWQAMWRLAGAGLLAGCVGIARTRNGGVHLFFPASGDRSHSLPFLDFKASGGYVVLPPSRVPGDLPGSSGVYEWLEWVPRPGSPLDWARARRLLCPAPAVRAPRVPGTRASAREARELARVVREAPEGQRNNTLFRALCTALRACLDVQPILDAALENGLGDDEVQVTFQNARRTLGVEP